MPDYNNITVNLKFINSSTENLTKKKKNIKLVPNSNIKRNSSQNIINCLRKILQ